MSDLKPLTQEQRHDARESAIDALQRMIGDRPDRESFDHHTASTYPPSVTRLIAGLCLVLLLAAFTPSAIRLYTIGSQTFGQTISNTVAVRLVGLATVLSAEIGQVVFSLALATLGTTRSARNLLYTSALIATLIALVGNVQIALPGHTRSPFAWFESIAPPLLVLSTAYVLKEQMLDSVRERHANERAYQDALSAWQSATAAPEDDPRWGQVYANALKDAIRRANNRRGETLAAMTTADWRQAVYLEIQAEQWYSQPEATVPVSMPSPLVATVMTTGNGNGNGYHN